VVTWILFDIGGVLEAVGPFESLPGLATLW
jgi:hypothetical protein